MNLNTADAQTLTRELKGIGASKARAIVAYRESMARSARWTSCWKSRASAFPRWNRIAASSASSNAAFARAGRNDRPFATASYHRPRLAGDRADGKPNTLCICQSKRLWKALTSHGLCTFGIGSCLFLLSALTDSFPLRNSLILNTLVRWIKSADLSWMPMDRAFAAVIHNLFTGLSTASVDNLFNASNGASCRSTR